MNKIIQFFEASAKGIWLLIRYGPAKVNLWREQSMIDDLTGLYNRRFLQEAGKRELAKATRSERQGLGYPVSFIMVDIDKFKKINDKEGHLVGDEILQGVAVLLKKCCREVDVVCRVGGDEFIILLPETAEDGAQLVADRITKLAEEYLFSSQRRPIRLSCGVAVGSGFSLEEVKKIADAKMYQEKRSKLKV